MGDICSWHIVGCLGRVHQDWQSWGHNHNLAQDIYTSYIPK